ncbi:MAG TPA: cytochrome c-type biogenesis protein [Xanthobacteraceae bacterium]|nr:cytochrome c-type biogenesis protein [Xanthobacteraceae bacterium]
MRRAPWGALLLALITLSSFAAYAVLPDEMLPDRALESRARALSRSLRCMVCQNQSIDDSEAPLARDLRILVRERLKQGDSDTQVLDYLTARYGEFVLLKPPLAWHTALLWFTPLGLLVVGAIGLGIAVHRRRGAVEPLDPHLSPAEEARLAAVLRPPDSPGPGKVLP